MVLTALQIANNPKSVKGGLERADGSNPEMGEVVARRCRGGQDHGGAGDGAQPLDPRAKVGAEVETKEGGLRAGLIAHFHSASVPVKMWRKTTKTVPCACSMEYRHDSLDAGIYEPADTRRKNWTGRSTKSSKRFKGAGSNAEQRLIPLRQL
jgi:hypothetical protein